jgi:uncharacterized protein (TIGR03437 family)
MKLVLLLLFLALGTLADAQTGVGVPELAVFDRAVSALVTKYNLPGAALALGKDGRLVYARGFGVADLKSKEPVQPDSLFRIASVSKPITAMAVLKLVEEGRVTLDTKVLGLLGRTASDPRAVDITVRHLLQHSAGFDLDTWGFDPSFPDRPSLLALGAPLPPSRGDVLDFVFANLPLAFAPGTQYSYSNIGYMVLTEVIEKVTGQAYERYMRERILAPLGIERMRIGGSLLTERGLGEVRYWDKENGDAPIFEGLPEWVESPYGTFHLRVFESGGGWVSSMPDLIRFMQALDDDRLLRPETKRLITERPGYVPAGQTSWDGLGWGLMATPFGTLWGHDGALPGTSAWAVRGVNGMTLAIAANHLPGDEVIAAFFGELEESVLTAALTISRWPTLDQGSVYFPGTTPRIAHAGVVNAASGRPGVVAAGSAVTVFGLNLTGGAVRINGTLAETLWTGPNQLTVRVPASVSGQASFQVGNSNTEMVTVQGAAPGLFTVSRNGYGPAAALNQDGTVNSGERPARPGSFVVLYGTGLGVAPTVLVGGPPAEVVYVGAAPGLPVGVQQLNVRLPGEVGPGAVAVSFGGESEVTIAVRP